MINLKTLSIAVVIFYLLFSCTKEVENPPKINGLWIVKKVKMNDQEMTPIARWMRFNADSTQSSGNGWLQHSVGTWSLRSDNLSVTNTNGIKDNAEPFKVKLFKNNMTWSRVEEGMKVSVFLERTNKLPTSEANKLYGLWKMDSIIEDDKDISDNLNPDDKAMLFLRWDNTFELRNYPKGIQYGVFKTHGHRLQIDMVSYSKSPKYQFYEFSIIENKLVLKSTNSNKEIKLTRIHQFLK